MKKEIIYLFIIITIIAVSYSIIPPLFPFIALNKGISETTIGVIFTCIALSDLVTIPLTNYFISFFGRKRLCKVAITLSSLGTFSFGFIDRIQDPNNFILISCLIMLCQGIGFAIVFVMCYSIGAGISDLSSLKINICYLELAESFGSSMGPVIVSGFYFVFGNNINLPFYIYGSISFILCNILFNKINVVEENTKQKKNFWNLIVNFEIILPLTLIILDCINNTFIFPVFTNHLFNKFGINCEIGSLFFAFEIFGYLLGLQMINKINKNFGNKITMIIGLLINCIGILLLCPVLILPQNYILITIGMTLIGFGGVLMTIPSFVELMLLLENKFNLNETEATDNSSEIFNFSCAIGEAIGPLIGGYFTEKRTFNFTCYVVSILNFSFCFFFFLVNIKNIGSELKGIEASINSSNNSSINYPLSTLGTRERKVSFSFKKYAIPSNSMSLNDEGEYILLNI